MKYTADTYLNEGNYASAKQLYEKALHCCWQNLRQNTLQAGCLMARLAEIGILQEDINEFQQSFENVERIYLLCQESDVSDLLHALIDLSWAASLQGYIDEIKSVNILIANIKQLEQEKLFSSAA